MVGKVLHCNPPYHLIGEFLEAVTAAYAAAPLTTRCTFVLPYWPSAPWYKKYIARRNAPLEVIEGAGEDGATFKENLRLFTYPPAGEGTARVQAGPTNWSVLVCRMPPSRFSNALQDRRPTRTDDGEARNIQLLRCGDVEEHPGPRAPARPARYRPLPIELHQPYEYQGIVRPVPARDVTSCAACRRPAREHPTGPMDRQPISPWLACASCAAVSHRSCLPDLPFGAHPSGTHTCDECLMWRSTTARGTRPSATQVAHLRTLLPRVQSMRAMPTSASTAATYSDGLHRFTTAVADITAIHPLQVLPSTRGQSCETEDVLLFIADANETVDLEIDLKGARLYDIDAGTVSAESVQGTVVIRPQAADQRADVPQRVTVKISAVCKLTGVKSSPIRLSY